MRSSQRPAPSCLVLPLFLKAHALLSSISSETDLAADPHRVMRKETVTKTYYELAPP
jgi:hypothetical protein